MRPNLLDGRRRDEPDYLVMSGGMTVGRIYEDAGITNPEARWFWAINGVHAEPGVMQIHGRAAKLDEAKNRLRENWQRWLAWAKLAELLDQ